MTSSINKAKKLYTEFVGEEPNSFQHYYVPDIDEVLVVIGTCDAIAYTTKRDGRVQSFQHEFRPKSRPALAVSPDGRRLYLLAGRYKFTSRGIVDK